MSKRLALSILALMLSPLFPVEAGGCGKAAATAEAYMREEGLDFAYELSRDGSRVILARGRVSSSLTGDAVPASRQFLIDRAEMFGIDREQIIAAPARVLKSRAATHVSFTQLLGGIPVMGPATAVHLDDASRVMLVQNNFRHLKSIPSAVPVVSAEESKHRARQVCAEKPGEITVGAPTLVFRDSARGMRLTWRVPVHRASTPPASYTALVDAADRDAAPARIDLVRDATGTGAVFLENPAVTPQLESVLFKRLDSTGMLSGPDVRTYDGSELESAGSVAYSDTLRRLSTAKSATRTYSFDPASDSRFSEAMTYYHLTRAQEVMRSMGFTMPVKQLPAVVNLPMINAFYCRCDHDEYYDGRGVLGFGNGLGVTGNFAHDADIVYHEYGHRVLDIIQPAILEEFEHNYGGAYHEAWGDILAAGISGNPKLGEHALTEKDTGEYLGRSLQNSRRYPENVRLPGWGISEVHWTGEIIGGAFWDLYEKIGSSALQALADANFLLDGSENFFGIRDAVRHSVAQADQDAVDQAFAAHGISGPDPRNPGRIKKLMDVYTYGTPYGDPGKHTVFVRGRPILIGVDAIINDTAPGYNLVADLTVTHADKFAAIYNIGGWMAEATNGMRTWRGRDQLTPIVLLTGKDNPRGAYEATVTLRLGGTDQTFTRTLKFTIE